MPNRLIDATSPYLLQHAHNPVDWYEWGPEALSRAREEHKPILLSVGYSACHWCHVMERESFEDETTAAQMNRDFVCIKVDREERPDIDALYMCAVQAITGGGGWPMTVFLEPDGTPFYGGTYFPPVASHGMPSFRELMAQMSLLYQEGTQIVRAGEELTRYLEQVSCLPEPDGALTGDWLSSVHGAAEAAHDELHGGFGVAPKFPSHGLLDALLAHHQRAGSDLEMVTHTLDAMAKGGMYDLLAGGFARYSVDAEWRIPHFEKMLYDSAQLVPTYLDAWRLTADSAYLRIVRDTLSWAAREMRLSDGGFAAATDADSEGVEGKYFAWTPDQLTAILGPDGARVAELTQVTEGGTFEHGMSVLRLERPLEDLEEGDRALLQESFPRLLEARNARIPPVRDDKVVFGWNAMMISAFARAGFALDEDGYRSTAVQAAWFLTSTLVIDGRLQRSWLGGRVSGPAFSDDYALWMVAQLDLYEATGDAAWIAAAVGTAEQLVALFWDPSEGGLFHAGHDTEPLLARTKPVLGGAEPGANGVAALGFVRLGRLIADEQWLDRAEQILRALQPLLARAPLALGPEAIAASWLIDGGREVGLVGEGLEDVLRTHYDPFRVVAKGPVVPWMRDRPMGGESTAYVCENQTCRLPVTTVDALRDVLEEVCKPRR